MPGDALSSLLGASGAHLVSIEVTDAELDQLSPLEAGEAPALDSPWSPKRLREFRAGRHVAHAALRQLGHERAPLLRDADGVPSWPAAVAASITHTGDRRTFAAACVSSSVRALGLDAESQRLLTPELVERILTGEEARVLSEYGALAEMTLLAFSAKEAFYKCVFPRLRRFIGFHEAHFALTSATGRGPGSHGEFTVRSPLIEPLVGSAELRGCFSWDPERVVSLVVWE